MSPYALYPLTNQRAVSHRTGLAGELSIAAYKAIEAIDAVGKWFVRRSNRAAAIGELSRLDDRLLEDIGVNRHEIHEVVEAMLDAPPTRPVAPPPVAQASPFATSQIPVADNDNKAVIAIAN